MKTLQIGTTFRIVGVLAALGIVVFPFYWMLVTALTGDDNMFGAVPQLIPDFSRIGVFADVLGSHSVQLWLMNSTLIAAGTAALSVVLAIPVAYALSRYSFKGKVLLTLGLLLTQMLPEALLVVPMFGIFRQLDLLNSLFSLIMANTAFVMPVVAFILKGAIDGIPKSIEEAARVDGCLPLSILLRIILPLIGPTVAAITVIAFFHGWNEYVFAQTFIFDPAKQPASVGLAGFVGELSTPIQSVMAVAIMYTLPAVVFYLFAQKYFVSGITAGGVKG